MTQLDTIALQHSLDKLKTIPGVQVIRTWQQTPQRNIWTLQIRLELIEADPTPFLPKHTDWYLVVDFEKDDRGKTSLYPSNGEGGMSATFPHQMFNGHNHEYLPSCRSGHLCTASGFDGLAANRNSVPQEPKSTIERIVWHVRRGLEWLFSAAKDTLSLPDSPFELPDYNFGRHKNSGLIAYYEDGKSLALWEASTIESGIVELTNLPRTSILLTEKFLDAKRREVIYEPDWGRYVRQLGSTFSAFWLKIPELPVTNKWQAPATVDELQTSLNRAGKDLQTLLSPLWNKIDHKYPCTLLVGAPVPKKMNGPMSYIHWQGLLVAPTVRNMTHSAMISLSRHNMSKAKHALNWMARSENWHPSELQNRGRLDQRLCNANVLLIGAGALGSCIAEQLVRMGVNNLVIVDDEKLEAGNLVRHTLVLDDLIQFKAKSLAERLNRTSPSARVSFVVAKIPATSNRNLKEAMREATIIIDATADDNVLRSMPLADQNPDALFISLSLSLESRNLYFYSDKAGQFSRAAFEEWFAPFLSEQDALVQQMDLPRDVGCWLPLTPARLNRIQGLSGIAIELTEKVFQDQSKFSRATVINWPEPIL